jgi:hypothetical protein
VAKINKGHYLRIGEFLRSYPGERWGDYLSSVNGSFFADMQGDGNFCIYHGSDPEHYQEGSAALWCSMRLAPAPCFVAMQGDGNVCVYRGSGPADNIYGPAVWCSMSQAPQPCFAVLEDEGRLWVYRGNGPADQQSAVWCNNPPKWKVPICGTSGGIPDQILQEVEVVALSKKAAEAHPGVQIALRTYHGAGHREAHVCPGGARRA